MTGLIRFLRAVDVGKGARAAVGIASLPSNIAVETEAIVELHDEWHILVV